MSQEEAVRMEPGWESSAPPGLYIKLEVKDDPESELSAQAGHIEHELKEELLFTSDDECGWSAEAARAGLYTDHTVKDELVVGPEEMHRPTKVVVHPDDKNDQERSNVEEPSELPNEFHKRSENKKSLGDKQDSISSDLNESHNDAAEEIKHISDTTFGSDSIADSIDSLPKYTRPPREVSVTESVKPLSRRANPDTWIKNVAMKRRREGLPYETNKRCRPAKVPKPIDCAKCKFKCTETFTLQDREKLCREYWRQDFVSKKNFILSRVTVQPPKRVLVNRTRPRPYSTKCYIDIGSKQKQVCQQFFCSTLNITASVIRDAVKHRNSLGLYSESADPRGSREPPNKTSAPRVQDVVDHINSFPIMQGHNNRKTSKRLYLDRGLSLPKMYELYLKKYKEKEPVSSVTYRRIFSRVFKLSFFVPKKDQCQTCKKYHAADEQKKIILETAYQAHIERKEESAREKENDKIRAETNKKFISVSFDLQANLQIPCSKIDLLYYSRKLTLYNLFIYESALPNNAYCFPWLEVHGRNGSTEIGTILLHYLSKCVSRKITEISLFSDSLSGQNRNQNISAILLWAVNKIDHLQVIEQKFLESGHLCMEADYMSRIEKAKKHTDIFSITDWMNIFKSARTKAYYYKPNGNDKVMKPPYKIKEFKYNEFYDLKDLAEAMLKNDTKDSEGNTVNWLKIKRIRYVKNDQNIYFNYDMSTDFLTFETRPVQMTLKSAEKGNPQSNPNFVEPLLVEFKLPELKQLYSKTLPISAAKKRDLVNLCQKDIIPEEYQGWFESLECEDSIVDRVPDVAADETSSSDEED